MKNFLKGGVYVAIFSCLALFLYFSFSNYVSGQSFRNEYRANSERIKQQQLEYNETQQRIMATVNDLEAGIGEVIDRVGVIENGVDILKGINYKLEDGSVETSILGDRNVRLLQELESRLIESKTE